MLDFGGETGFGFRSERTCSFPSLAKARFFVSTVFMNPEMPQNSPRPPGSVRPSAANGQSTARAGSPIASTSTVTPAAMDFEPSTPTPTQTENIVDLSIGSAVAYLVER
ncbi:hypothetical protein CDAR_538071, partial [Caerostris darwini]